MECNKDIEEAISNLVEKFPQHTFFIGVSGGVDSMVLLHAVNRMKLPLEVMHVNYQLRGKESHADEHLVERYCQKYHIPFHVHRVPKDHFNRKGINLQEEARHIRYDFFKACMAKNPSAKLLLAHHWDDQVETFYLNLARKSGILGLSCMQQFGHDKQRPFLTITKRDLYVYAKAHQIPFREDQSNQKNDYQRNVLRNLILPELRRNLPHLDASIKTLIDHFQAERKEIESMVNPFLQKIEKEGILALNFFDQPIDFQFVLLNLLNIPSKYQTAFSKLPEIQVGGCIELSHHQYLRIWRDRTNCFFEKRDEPTPDFQIEMERVTTLPSTYHKTELYLDLEKIKGQLICRKPQKGDRIYPIGINGSQLISDVIKDAKIDIPQKKEVLLLVDDESIISCMGLKVDRRKLATTSTQHIIKVTLKPR